MPLSVGKSASVQSNYRVQQVIKQSWNLGQTFAYVHIGEKPHPSTEYEKSLVEMEL